MLCPTLLRTGAASRQNQALTVRAETNLESSCCSSGDRVSLGIHESLFANVAA